MEWAVGLGKGVELCRRAKQSLRGEAFSIFSLGLGGGGGVGSGQVGNGGHDGDNAFAREV